MGGYPWLRAFNRRVKALGASVSTDSSRIPSRVERQGWVRLAGDSCGLGARVIVSHPMAGEVMAEGGSTLTLALNPAADSTTTVPLVSSAFAVLLAQRGLNPLHLHGIGQPQPGDGWSAGDGERYADGLADAHGHGEHLRRRHLDRHLHAGGWKLQHLGEQLERG